MLVSQAYANATFVLPAFFLPVVRLTRGRRLLHDKWPFLTIDLLLRFGLMSIK